MRILFCVGFQINLENELSGTGNWINGIIYNLKRYSSITNLEIGVCMIDSRIQNVESSLIDDIHIFKIPSVKNNKIKRLLANYALIDPHKNLLNDFKKIENLFKPEICQIFGYESQFVRLIGRIDIPIIIHFQGFKSALEYKYFQRITKRELNKHLTITDILSGSVPYFNKKKSRITSFMADFDSTLVQFVLGRTDWDRMVTRAVSPQASYFYCQEILREIFYKHEWKTPQNKSFRLFTTTGEGPTKNVDLIFEVANLLEKYHPSFNFTWHIAGIDEVSMIVKIMRKRGHKAKSIKLLGRLNSNELLKEILDCNLFVYPSGLDNSPNALMEAMLVGAPVLSNNSGGINTVVDNGKSGILVSEGEPFVMVGAIIELARNKKLLSEIGAKSREIALKRNDPELVVKQLECALMKIVDCED
jgi:glycosyltransferase involved in cell wall biosynthesis